MAQDNYTLAIDIWSVGCIFAELLSMMKSNYAYFTDRKPLFPGESCKLLSPDVASPDVTGEGKDALKEMQEFSEKMDKNDQLGKVFQVIGTPKDESDIEFIQSE